MTALQDWGPVKQLILRTMPIWLTVVLLLLTRIDPIGLRSRLLDPNPNFDIRFGYLFKFELSPSLVVRVSEILAEVGDGEQRNGLQWTYEILYIPFLLPFLVASAATVAVFRGSLPRGMSVVSPLLESFRRHAPSYASLNMHSAVYAHDCIFVCLFCPTAAW